MWIFIFLRLFSSVGLSCVLVCVFGVFGVRHLFTSGKDFTATLCTEVWTAAIINPLVQVYLVEAFLLFARKKEKNTYPQRSIDKFISLWLTDEVQAYARINDKSINDLCRWFDLFICLLLWFLSRSPPETKESTMDSPDAQQRQEWFAQYFSFWLTTEPAGFSMSTKLEVWIKKKIQWKKRNDKKEEKNVKLFVLYCHWFVDQHIFRPSQEEIHLMFWELPCFVNKTSGMSWCNLFQIKKIYRLSTSCCWLSWKCIDPRTPSTVISPMWSDLINYLWLFRCRWVCLLVQWQWSSVWLMFLWDLPHFLLQFLRTRRAEWCVNHAANCWTTVRNRYSIYIYIYIKTTARWLCSLYVGRLHAAS